ncbi:MAG: associated Golgi protein-related protein [Bacteroidetes bacterium]|jgi:membrane protein DedA with SNARE-associated domain|nr:associated Golgi protein-related protein [Bacteroidota bacterium]
MIKKIFISFVLIFTVTFINAENNTEQKKDSSLTIIQKVENWYEGNMNYASITALMTIESSFIPFPSEVVIPPAAYIASKPNSHLNIFLVVLFGTLGALIGAYINYFLAMWLGRPIMYRLADSKVGKILLLSSEKIKKAEQYFNDHGKTSTFVGRLIPGIRQLISLPAGLARMNLLSFTIFTTLGALIWNTTLALLGYLAHGQADLINEYSHELSIIILVLLALAIGFYIVRYFIRRRKK